jgi:hypothetical protein
MVELVTAFCTVLEMDEIFVPHLDLSNSGLQEADFEAIVKLIK